MQESLRPIYIGSGLIPARIFMTHTMRYRDSFLVHNNRGEFIFIFFFTRLVKLLISYVPDYNVAEVWLLYKESAGIGANWKKDLVAI